MPKYRLIIPNTVRTQLMGLSEDTRLRILRRIKILEDNPLPYGNTIKRLRGTTEPLYRLRVGDYRVIFHLEGTKVRVEQIVHRRDLDRALRTMR
jgi:mRNA interferase RelE/StbE